MPGTTQVSSLCAIGHATGGLDGTETFGAVFSHAGHKNADGGEAKFLGDGMKENVDGRTVSVDGSGVRENDHFASGHAADHHVAIAGTNEDAAGDEQIAGLGLLNIEGAAFVQAAREHVGVKPSGMC